MARLRGLFFIAIFTLGIFARILSGLAAPNPFVQAGYAGCREAITKSIRSDSPSAEDSTPMKIRKSKRRLRLSFAPMPIVISVLPRLSRQPVTRLVSQIAETFVSFRSAPTTPPPIALA